MYYFQTPRHLNEVAATGSPYGDPPYNSSNTTNDSDLLPQVFSILVVVVVAAAAERERERERERDREREREFSRNYSTGVQ
jgi:hypothetical protein